MILFGMTKCVEILMRMSLKSQKLYVVQKPISVTNIDKNEDNEMLDESNSWLPWFYHKLKHQRTLNYMMWSFWLSTRWYSIRDHSNIHLLTNDAYKSFFFVKEK